MGARSNVRARELGGLRAPAAALVALVAVACEVPPPEADTGGLGGGDLGADVCERGISVISSDAQSTSIAFVDWRGAVISPRVLTSGSADPGLTTALSGDVVAPTIATSDREAVFIDRYPASVLTWVDLGTGKPRAQLSVRTGFDANAQDYVQIDETLGFVARYEANPAPGRSPFDAGSDVLVVDPRVPAIVGRVDLEGALDGESGVVPTPTRLVLARGKLVALLGVLSTDFQAAGDVRLVVIDTSSRAIEETIRIEGLRNCQGLAASPDGTRVAVSCTGLIELDGATDVGAAGVAVVAIGEGGAPSKVTARFPATLFGRSPQFSIAFAADQTLLFPTFGADPAEGGEAHGDDLVALDLATGVASVLFTSTRAFDLGDVRCAAPCGACFATDAGAEVVRRFTVGAAGVLSAAERVSIDDGVGLPPRYLGAL